MQVNQKTFVITGGGNGIGRAVSLQLLQKGARVIALDIKEEALKETQRMAREKRTNFSYKVLNIADREAVNAFSEELLSNEVKVDGLINNAGIIQPFVKTKDLDYAAIQRVMQVNFFGTLHMVQAFLPHLLKRPEAHIVNVSSMGGFLPVPGQSVYGASKAAVKLLTEALYAELMYTNVKVTLIFPGAIGTNISANSGVLIPKTNREQQQKFKSMPVDEAAAQIISAVEHNKLRAYIGSDSSFMNFLYRIHPTFATRFIAKKMKDLLPQ